MLPKYPPNKITASDQIFSQLCQIGKNGSYGQEGAAHGSCTGTGQVTCMSASYNFAESVSV